MRPNQLLEVNRQQSARFWLACEDGPGHHGLVGSIRRSPQQQRWQIRDEEDFSGVPACVWVTMLQDAL